MGLGEGSEVHNRGHHIKWVKDGTTSQRGSVSSGYLRRVSRLVSGREGETRAAQTRGTNVRTSANPLRWGGATAFLIGVGLLIMFMIQNTEDVRLDFLTWSFTWRSDSFRPRPHPRRGRLGGSNASASE